MIFKGGLTDDDTNDYFEQGLELENFQKLINENADKYNYTSIDIFNEAKDIFKEYFINFDNNKDKNTPTDIDPKIKEKIDKCIKDKNECLGFNVPFQCYWQA